MVTFLSNNEEIVRREGEGVKDEWKHPTKSTKHKNRMQPLPTFCDFNRYSILDNTRSEDDELDQKDLDNENKESGLEMHTIKKIRMKKKVKTKKGRTQPHPDRNTKEHMFLKHGCGMVENAAVGMHEESKYLRCQNCFKTHFPYPKLCRWTMQRKVLMPDNSEQNITLSEDTIKSIEELPEETIQLLKERIKFIEGTIQKERKREKEKKLLRFFLKSPVIQLLCQISVFKPTRRNLSSLEGGPE